MGTVVQSPAPPPLPPSEFLARMDGEPQHWQRRILPMDLIEVLPKSEPPPWAPPVEMRVAAELDGIVVKFCEAGFRNGHWFVDWPSFYQIIHFIWTNRLPLEAREVWAVLEAHGIPPEFRDELSTFFRRGRELLVYAVGKRPFKNRRVNPLRASG